MSGFQELLSDLICLFLFLKILNSEDRLTLLRTIKLFKEWFLLLRASLVAER